MSKIRYMENMLNQNMFTEEQREKHYTVKQASERIGIDYSTLNKACHSGKIRCSTVPNPSGNGNKFLISESALMEYDANRERRNTKYQSADSMTVEDLANEILRRVKNAYDEGYRQGRKDAKTEFMSAFKGIK